MSLRARVENGGPVSDERATSPEEIVAELTLGDDVGPEERRAMHTASQRGVRDAERFLQLWRQPRSLKVHLLRIVAVAFLPLMAFSTIMLKMLATEQETTFRRGAMERTFALLTAVDTELKRSIAALEALAASETLDDADLAAFKRDARRVLGSRPEWVNIHLVPPPSTLQVLNLLRLPEQALHDLVDRDSFETVLRCRQPAVGNLFREPFTSAYTFPVRVPVIRGEEVRYVLSALVDPGVISDLLSPQGLPPDWVGVVLDTKDTIVARTIDEEGSRGQPASDSLRSALTRSSSGWIRGSTVEGWPVYTPFHRSAFSGWSLAMGIPRAAVEAPMIRFLTHTAGFGALLLASSFGIAWLLSQRAAQSLAHLSVQARDLGLGRENDHAATPPSNVTEVEDLRRAFERAGALIRSRSEERDRVVESLRLAEVELRKAEQRKDQFLAMLGHELRNPLGVVATAVHVLRATSSNLADEPHEMIARQVEHMTKLINDLLDVSRISQGRLEMRPQVRDLVEIARESEKDYRRSMEESGLTLEVQLPSTPIWTKVDHTRITQAIGNLLQNAMKYTDEGGQVCLVVREDEGGQRAVIEVADTGVGMGAGMLEYAFEPFSQADRTLARSRGGLGLGLPLVKEIVEAHGGTVDAFSRGPQMGTRMTICLPLWEDVDPDGPDADLADSREHRLRVPSTRDQAASTLQIVVIEDNEAAARSLKLLLESEGHTVAIARTGAEGVRLASSTRPDAVISDIGLPEMDGYEVARRLRAVGSALLLAVSGYGQTADRDRALRAGFDHHLTKPVDLDELLRILGRCRPRSRDPGGPEPLS